MQYMDLSLLLYIGMLALGVFVGSRKAVRSRPCRWLPTTPRASTR